jgi:hypothetical protein
MLTIAAGVSWFVAVMIYLMASSDRRKRTY